MDQHTPPSLLRPTITLWVLLASFILLLATFVVGSLRKPVVPTVPVSLTHPQLIGDSLVGPATVTLDATAEDRWTFFDFTHNAVIEHPGPLDWDLGVRRFHVIANGGTGFAGQGGVADLGRVAFDSVRELPASGYDPTDRDSINPAIRHWYDYGWASHLLTTSGHTYAVRTARGKYAKIAVVSYYCPGAEPGCLTLRYAYQGDGGRRVAGTTRR